MSQSVLDILLHETNSTVNKSHEIIVRLCSNTADMRMQDVDTEDFAQTNRFAIGKVSIGVENPIRTLYLKTLNASFVSLQS